MNNFNNQTMTFFGSKNSTTMAGSWISDQLIASVLMILIAAIGFTSNIASIVYCARLKSLRNQFCILFVSTALADCGVLSAFGFWAAPMLFTESDLALTRIGKTIAGLWILPCWVASVTSTLSIAINRYIAIARPSQYEDIYSMRNLTLNIILNWAIGIAYAVPFAFGGCEMYFDTIDYFAYRYSVHEKCGLILDYICSAVCVTIFVTIFAVNVATFLKLWNMSRDRAAANRNSNPNISQSEVIWQQRRKTRHLEKRRKDKSFFIQVCLNNTIFEVVMICYHLINPSHYWANFFIKTLVWEMGHASNGFIFLAMNQESKEDILGRCCGIKHLLGEARGSAEIEIIGGRRASNPRGRSDPSEGT